MKLYRHYKQKYYKLHGIAKHSETLTDVAYYECLYENSSGQFWVRPSELFFGTIEHNNTTIPRFAEVPLEIATTLNIGEQQITHLQPLIESIFGHWDQEWFTSHLQNHSGFHLLEARIEGRLVGFKLGYKENHRTFYSWLGGVAPEFRGLGIGGDLLKIQHQWCREAGYERIRTKTQNRFKEMLLLNLRHGFEVIGTQDSSDEGGLKIILEKKLKGAP